MLKKVFSVILLVFAILLSGQATVTPKAEAYADFVIVDDYYAFTDNGIEYYIYYVQYNDEIYGGGIQVELKGVKNGKTVDNLKYLLNSNGTYDLLSSRHPGNERGYISSDSKASTVFNIAVSDKLKKAEKLINIQEIYRKANELLNSKSYSQAISYYEQLLEQFIVQGKPDQWINYTGKAYTEMGICYVELNNYDKAKECYDRAKTISIESYDDYGYYYYGLLCEKLNLYKEATYNYDIALQKTYRGSPLQEDISIAKQRIKELSKKVKK